MKFAVENGGYGTKHRDEHGDVTDNWGEDI